MPPLEPPQMARDGPPGRGCVDVRAQMGVRVLGQGRGCIAERVGRDWRPFIGSGLNVTLFACDLGGPKPRK